MARMEKKKVGKRKQERLSPLSFQLHWDGLPGRRPILYVYLACRSLLKEFTGGFSFLQIVVLAFCPNIFTNSVM